MAYKPKPRILISGNDTTGWYPKGMDRLIASLEGNHQDFYVLQEPRGSQAWRGYPINQGHVIKAIVLERVLNRYPNATVLWVDCSAWAVAPLAPVFEHIEEHKLGLWLSGFFIGETCNSRSLSHFSLTREEAMDMDEFASGFMGIDLASRKGMFIALEFIASAKAGLFFDPRPSGAIEPPRRSGQKYYHRHDQSIWSILVHEYGLSEVPKKMFARYHHQFNFADTALIYQGM